MVETKLTFSLGKQDYGIKEAIKFKGCNSDRNICENVFFHSYNLAELSRSVFLMRFFFSFIQLFHPKSWVGKLKNTVSFFLQAIQLRIKSLFGMGVSILAVALHHLRLQWRDMHAKREQKIEGKLVKLFNIKVYFKIPYLNWNASMFLLSERNSSPDKLVPWFSY